MFRMKKTLFAIIFTSSIINIYAFDSGLTLGFKANMTGSLTRPHINKKDMEYLGADFMEGMLGYVTTGDAELTYIFDSIRFFHYKDASVFGGLGLSFNLGLGEGFSGQISGSTDTPVGLTRVYCRVYMTPVLKTGVLLKAFLLNNRMSINGGLGLSVPMDPHPTYEMYSNLTPEKLKIMKTTGVDFSGETGTLVVSQEQMKKINPVGYTLKLGLDYYQPVTGSMEIVLGSFLSYLIYKPGYVTMPKKIEEAAKAGGEVKGIDVNFARDPIKSFYMNSLDFGLNIGLIFKV